MSQDYPLKRDVIDRRDTNIEKKMLIAQKAFDLISGNETIFLDISTTNIMVADLLAKSHKRVTVVTNMIDINADSGSESQYRGYRNRRDYVPYGKWVYGGSCH